MTRGTCGGGTSTTTGTGVLSAAATAERNGADPRQSGLYIPRQRTDNGIAIFGADPFKEILIEQIETLRGRRSISFVNQPWTGLCSSRTVIFTEPFIYTQDLCIGQTAVVILAISADIPSCGRLVTTDNKVAEIQDLRQSLSTGNGSQTAETGGITGT